MALDLSKLVTIDELGTFLANSDSRFAAISSVPTDTSDLTNGAGYLTSADVASAISAGITSAFASMTWADVEGSGE